MHQDPWMVAVLFASPVKADEIESRIGTSVERRDGRHDLHDKPECSILTRYDGKVIIIDLYNHQWHDTSGNDQGPTSPQYKWDEAHDRLLAAPWSLKRAIQQYRGMDDASIAAANHSAFCLLRVPLQPAGNTIEAFNHLLQAVMQILKHPAASCYFNPRGEVLCGVRTFPTILQRYEAGELPPLELLINTRVSDIGAGWSLVDTVGLCQFELPDQELVYCQQKMQATDAMVFARNLAMHFIQHRPVLETGDTAGGPGGTVWESLQLGQGSLPPHRPVVRWLPEVREGIPAGMDVP